MYPCFFDPTNVNNVSLEKPDFLSVIGGSFLFTAVCIVLLTFVSRMQRASEGMKLKTHLSNADKKRKFVSKKAKVKRN